MADPASGSSPANNTNQNQTNLTGLEDTSTGPWALEETLKKVLGVLQKDLSNNNRQNRNFDLLNRNIDKLTRSLSESASDGQELQRKNNTIEDATRKALEDIRKSSERAARAQEEIRRSDKPSKNQARDNLIGGGGGTKGGMILGAVKDIAMAGANKVLDAGKAIAQSGGDVSNAMAGVAAAVPAIGGLLAASVQVSTNARDQMAALAKTGQTFNGNMIQFANEAADAALSTGQAVAILGENADAAAKIGGSNFLRLQREVRSTTEQFGRFGLSVEDQAKVLGTFTEIQMMRGRRDQANNAKAAAEFTAKMTALSKATGQSIDSLLQNEKSLEESADLFSASQAVYERFGKQAADNFEAVYRDVSDKLVGTAAQKPVEQLMANIGNWNSFVQSEMGQTFARLGKLDDLEKLRNAALARDDGEVMRILQSLSKDITTVGSDDASRAAALARTGNLDPTLFAGLKSLVGLNPNLSKNADQLAQENKEENASSGQPGSVADYDQNMTVVQEQLGKAYSAVLQSSLALLPGLQQVTVAAAEMTATLLGSEVVQDAIVGFSNAMVDATQHMQEYMSSLSIFETFESGLGWILGKLMNFGSWLGEVTGIGEGLGQILAGVGAWFGGKALIGKAGKGIASFFGFGGAGAGAAAAEGAGAAAGAGGILSRLGRFGAGAARGGVLSALFEGLGYVGEDGKALTERNILKSGINLLGGVAGGAVGSLAGPLGTVAGGAVGYAGAKKLSDWLLGPDEMKKPASKPAERQQETTPARPRPVPAQVRPASAPRQVNSEEDIRRRMAEIHDRQMKLQEETMASVRRRVEAQAATPPQPVRNSSNVSFGTPGVTVDSQTRQMEAMYKAGLAYKADRAIETPTAKIKKPTESAKVAFPVGDEMQNRQLQEMQTSNKLLAGIYYNTKPPVKPKPSVVMYNGGWY